MESVVSALAHGINPAVANIVLVLLCAGFAHVYVMLIRIQDGIKYMREKIRDIEDEKREEKRLERSERVALRARQARSA